MGLFSFFFPRVIHRTNSRINGKIEVVEWLGKRAIKVQGLEQSGPMVEKIWEKGIKTLHATRYTLHAPKILILGLGGGSAVRVINKHFPNAKILGIEIDPLMVKLGKEYLDLSKHKNLRIKITDAFAYVKELSGSNHFTKYDLILVDVFLGNKLPKEVESREFLSNIKKLLTNEGRVIFNRLRKKSQEAEFKKFLDKLKKIYHHIKVIKPAINYLIICS